MTQDPAEPSEQPILMGDNGLFGIVSEPCAIRRNTGVILLNSGLLHRVGPSRLYVHLSRQLARLGFVSARIDVSGKGDTPRRQGVNVEQSLLYDYDDVCQTLHSLYGLDRFILVGLCSGADDACAVAYQRDNVAGLVLLDGYAAKTIRYYFRYYKSRIFNLGSWTTASRRLFNRILHIMRRIDADESELTIPEVRHFASIEEARRAFEQISQHCERCLCIYTSASEKYYNYEGQLGRRFPTFRPKGGLCEIYLPAAKHTYPLAHHRRFAVENICDWAATFT